MGPGLKTLGGTHLIENYESSPSHPGSVATLELNYKQLLDEVFVISGIIKVEVSVITKTESNNCFNILYLQVISQFLAGSMKRIKKPFLLRCPRT